MDAAIDQVIQSGVPEHTSQWGWGATHSVPSRGSPRRKQDTTGVQSNSGQGIERTRSPAISEYGHKAPSAKSSNLRQGDAKDDESISSRSRGREREMIDCFGSDVFRIVLNNPTTSQRFLRFCQAHGRGESVEFLEKVTAYHRILDEASKLLGEIHYTYTSIDSPKQINISHHTMKRITYDIKATSQTALPVMENIFDGAQEEIEQLLAGDLYPRFVKHQLTTSAILALTSDKIKYQGLGNCFCLTDPSFVDNPITFASDGFVELTGYSRHDIIPQNCRFLQGPSTDPISARRLRLSIDRAEASIELILNYKKNGESFWNLLWVAPLFDENGSASFYLGGQVDCSSSFNSYADILRVLSLFDEENFDKGSPNNGRPPSTRSGPSSRTPSVNIKPRSSFFKTSKVERSSSSVSSRATIRGDADVDTELLDKVGNLAMKSKIGELHSAYSKYLVMRYSQSTGDIVISHFSAAISEMLIQTLPNGTRQTLYGREIFKVLADNIAPASSSFSSSPLKGFKMTVRENIKKGRSVSVEIGLLTGKEATKSQAYGGYGAGANLGSAASASGPHGLKAKRVEEKFLCHWTPMKDKEGKVGWIVLTLSPK